MTSTIVEVKRGTASAGRYGRIGGMWFGTLGPTRGSCSPTAEAPTARAHAARLDELRLAATEDRVDAELGMDRYAAVVPELRQLIAAHPLRERPPGPAHARAVRRRPAG